MVVAKKKALVTRALILSKISEWDIYRYEFGDFTVGRPTLNHLRGEKKPSFTIFLGLDGKMHHYDQGDDRWHGDCFDLVCQKYRISLYKALEHIAKMFMLTDGEPEAYRSITSQYTKPVMDPKRYSLIQVAAKKFTKTDMSYWSQYKVITEDKLKKHEVYSLKDVYLNRKKVAIGKHETVFGYRYPHGWKIMFPERKKEEKWLSNIPLDTPEGLQNLDKDHNALVIKSKKCLMVVEEIYPWVCSMQNESLGSVSEETGKYINENSKEVFYGGDADVAGKKASYKITGKFSWKHINVPDPYLPLKDWSDWSTLDDGIEKITEHFKNKKLMI